MHYSEDGVQYHLQIRNEDIGKYVILTGYRKYSIGNKNVEKLEEGHGINEYNEKVFIKFNDIKRVEKIGEKRAKEKIYKEIQN